MILLWLIIIPMAGACAAWWVERRGPQWPRWTALICLGAELALAGVLWFDDLEPEFEVGALDQLELLGEERPDAYQARRSLGALAWGPDRNA